MGGYSRSAVAQVFGFPALGGLLFGYDIGATSFVLTQLESEACASSTDRMDPCRAARNSVSQPWQLDYEFAVPSASQMKIPYEEGNVYYIW